MNPAPHRRGGRRRTTPANTGRPAPVQPRPHHCARAATRAPTRATAVSTLVDVPPAAAADAVDGERVGVPDPLPTGRTVEVWSDTPRSAGFRYRITQDPPHVTTGTRGVATFAVFGRVGSHRARQLLGAECEVHGMRARTRLSRPAGHMHQAGTATRGRRRPARSQTAPNRTRPRHRQGGRCRSGRTRGCRWKWPSAVILLLAGGGLLRLGEADQRMRLWPAAGGDGRVV